MLWGVIFITGFGVCALILTDMSGQVKRSRSVFGSASLTYPSGTRENEKAVERLSAIRSRVHVTGLWLHLKFYT